MRIVESLGYANVIKSLLIEKLSVVGDCENEELIIHPYNSLGEMGYSFHFTKSNLSFFVIPRKDDILLWYQTGIDTMIKHEAKKENFRLSAIVSLVNFVVRKATERVEHSKN
jgi:hypothetical protein